MYDNVVHLTKGKKFPNMIIAGDFNLPDISWDRWEVKTSPQYEKDLNQLAIDTMDDLALTQMVSEPTRGNNILDLLFSSCPDLVQNVTVSPGISDHSSVTAEVALKAKISKKKPQKVYMYGKADPEDLKRNLTTLRDSFLAASSGRSASDNWARFTKSLMDIIDKLVPQKIVRERHDLPWLNKSICMKIKQKNRLHWKAKKAKPGNGQNRWDTYRKAQQAVQNDIKGAYDKYTNSLFEDETGHPGKSFFKMLKAKRRDQVGVPPLRRKKDGKFKKTSRGKARVLSAQYSSVFKTEDTSTVPNLGPSPYSSMPRIQVTCVGVVKLLSKLNPKKAIGPDRVPTFILRDYAELIAPILRIIFQQSLDTGEVPDDWKSANIAAILKKADKNLASNYRPVSLTSVSCKVLEHIVFRSIMDHVDIHKILNHFQHGFRSQHSCETQLITTIEDLARGLNSQQQLDLLILDFSKAFDVVGHQRLLSKLFHYGIRGTSLKWMENWLTGRTQKVVVEGECSEETPVTSGVPQGTVLGPLMFILYINDISAETSSSIRLFADDCLLYRVINSTHDAEKLQGDLTQLCRWSVDWQMDFNAGKCHVLTVTRKQMPHHFPYTIAGVQLAHVHHHPYLGVELASDLNWSHHLDEVVPKAQRNLNLLRRNLYGCTSRTKETAYMTLVRPVLEYASSVWDPHQANHINRVERVQRRAARFVTGQHQWDVRVTGLMQGLGWRQLQERRLGARLSIFYKDIINGQSAIRLPSGVTHTTKTTWTSHDLQFTSPTASKDSYKFSFFPRTVRVWNILPHALVHAPSTETFKTRLHKEFLSGRMYIVPPRGQHDGPRLGSASDVAMNGPVY